MPQRTTVGLFQEIIALAADKPLAAITRVPLPPGFRDAPMSEAEYQAAKAGFLDELPGIRRWLAMQLVESIVTHHPVECN